MEIVQPRGGSHLSSNVMLNMKHWLYYAKKTLFGALMVAVFQAILYQEDKLLSHYPTEDRYHLPNLTNLLRDFVPEEHVATSVSAWLLFILSFLLYTRASAKCDSWLLAFTGVVAHIWASIAESLPSRVMVKHLSEDNGFIISQWVDEILWVVIPLTMILWICYSRYRASHSFRSILA